MADRAQIERELDDFVEGDSWPEPDEAGEPQPIPGEEIAAQVLRRIRRLEVEKATVSRVAADEIARIVAFRDDRVAGIDRDVAWGKRSLENYMRSVERPKTRSLRVANGKIGLTKTTFAVEVVDEKAFLEWCGVTFPEPVVPDGEKPPPDVSKISHPELVRLKPEPAKSALAKLEHASLEETTPDGIVRNQLLYTGDGSAELVPGVFVQRAKADRFTVTLGSE